MGSRVFDFFNKICIVCWTYSQKKARFSIYFINILDYLPLNSNLHFLFLIYWEVFHSKCMSVLYFNNLYLRDDLTIITRYLLWYLYVLYKSYKKGGNYNYEALYNQVSCFHSKLLLINNQSTNNYYVNIPLNQSIMVKIFYHDCSINFN